MAGIRTAGLFLMGSLAGFGAALLLFVARPLDMMTLLELSTINAFLAGVVLVTLGTLGGVVVARAGMTWRLRTSLGAIAVLAVLLGFVVEVRRRSAEYWGLALQHRAQAAGLSARYQLARFDPRVTRQRLAGLATLSEWQMRTAERFERAAYHPWLPLEPGPPAPK